MIIQHNIMALNSYRQLNGNNTALSKNLEKLSSGYKVNRAGDDAAGLAISEKMRAQIKGLETASKNALDGISVIQTAEGALTEVHSMLNRMVELATQAANGIYSGEERWNIQEEINSLNDEINRISDHTDFNGTFLLKGTRTNFNGGSTTATGAVTGANVVPGSGTVTPVATVAKADVDAVLALTTGNTKAITVGTDTFTFAFSGEEAGAQIAAPDILGGDDSADVVDALNNDNTFKTKYYAVDKGDGSIEILDIKDKPVTPAPTSISVGDTATAAALATKGGNAVETANVGSLIIDFYDSTGTGVASDPSAIHIDTQNIATIDDLVTALNADTTIGAAYTVAKNQAGDALEFTAKVTTNPSNNGSMTLQVGDTALQTVSVTLADMSASAIGTDQVKVVDNANTAAGAAGFNNDEAVANSNASIAVIKGAISTVSAHRAKLGALQNRLEHTINNLGVTTENITAAESRIRDTDMAKEMMAYTKNNILVQAAQSMLAQANQVPQGVLQLLR